MRKRTSKMESTRKIVKDSVFFFFFLSTPVVNAGGQRRSTVVVRADVARARGARVARDMRGARGRVARVGRVARAARGSSWGRVGTRGARGGALPDLLRRVAARGRVSGEPKTSGGAWGRVRGQIWPILVSMDKS